MKLFEFINKVIEFTLMQLKSCFSAVFFVINQSVKALTEMVFNIVTIPLITIMTSIVIVIAIIVILVYKLVLIPFNYVDRRQKRKLALKIFLKK